MPRSSGLVGSRLRAGQGDTGRPGSHARCCPARDLRAPAQDRRRPACRDHPADRPGRGRVPGRSGRNQTVACPPPLPRRDGPLALARAVPPCPCPDRRGTHPTAPASSRDRFADRPARNRASVPRRSGRSRPSSGPLGAGFRAGRGGCRRNPRRPAQPGPCRATAVFEPVEEAEFRARRGAQVQPVACPSSAARPGSPRRTPCPRPDHRRPTPDLGPRKSVLTSPPGSPSPPTYWYRAAVPKRAGRAMPGSAPVGGGSQTLACSGSAARPGSPAPDFAARAAGMTEATAAETRASAPPTSSAVRKPSSEAKV